jgi:hypothetical protein
MAAWSALAMCVASEQAYHIQTTGRCEAPIVSAEECGTAKAGFAEWEGVTVTELDEMASTPQSVMHGCLLAPNAIYFASFERNAPVCSSHDQCMCRTVADSFVKSGQTHDQCESPIETLAACKMAAHHLGYPLIVLELTDADKTIPTGCTIVSRIVLTMGLTLTATFNPFASDAACTECLCNNVRPAYKLQLDGNCAEPIFSEETCNTALSLLGRPLIHNGWILNDDTGLGDVIDPVNGCLTAGDGALAISMINIGQTTNKQCTAVVKCVCPDPIVCTEDHADYLQYRDVYDACAHSCADPQCGANCAEHSCGSACAGDDCGAACTGKHCATDCTGSNCGVGCGGTGCASSCTSPGCGANCTGDECASGCAAPGCGIGCIGDKCAHGCDNTGGSTGCGAECQGGECAGSCRGPNCGADCHGDLCAIDCVGVACGAGCVGDRCAGGCTADSCGLGCVGDGCAGSCGADSCGLGCVGDGCAAGCAGERCGMRCIGDGCAADCTGSNCGVACLGTNCGNVDTPDRKDSNLQCTDYTLEWHCAAQENGRCQWSKMSKQCFSMQVTLQWVLFVAMVALVFMGSVGLLTIKMCPSGDASHPKYSMGAPPPPYTQASSPKPIVM